MGLFYNDRVVSKKPLRIIELFAGYGSTSLSLKYLGVDFQRWKICEWAVKSIQSYKDLHFGDDNVDYSKNLTKEEVIDYLFTKGISSDYNTPMTFEQIQRLGEGLRITYNNMIATNNLGSICNVCCSDLNIVDTDLFDYIVTYSFPCQDLSVANSDGKGLDGERSGLLHEVERLLKECKNNNSMPQFLILENVPEVLRDKHFNNWVNFLSSVGYESCYRVCNSSDYGIPQNRERCFMVSWLRGVGDCYDFPNHIPLELKFKNLIERNVDERFYISEDISVPYSIKNWRDSTTNCGCVGLLGGKYEKMQENSRRVYSIDYLSPTLHTCCGGNRELKILDFNNAVRKLTPIESFRLMGVSEDDFYKIKYMSVTTLLHLAGDSIVTTVLMAIFGELLGIEWENKIVELYNKLGVEKDVIQKDR